MEVGIRSAARASASSGLCLYLKVSKDPGALGGGGFEGLAGMATTFFAAGGPAGAVLLDPLVVAPP